MQVRLQVVRGRSPPHLLTLDASTTEEARLLASSLGYAVLSVAEPSVPFARKIKGFGNRKFSVSVFVEQLRDLLIAGLSVIEAMEVQRRGARGTDVTTIESLERHLQQGSSLSAALASDRVFPELLVALVQASELTSNLPQCLSRYLEHEARATEIRHRLASTAIYPLLLTVVGALVLLFLLFYVVPRFSRVFEGMGGELPWSARAMIAWSATLQAHSSLWIAIGTAVVAAVSSLIGSATVRARLLARILDWPFLRDQLKVYFLARWYRASGMLIEGGIPLLQSLQLSNSLLPRALQPRGAEVEAAVRNGLSPSSAYAHAGMATPVAEQLMLAGERTGELGSVLGRIAHFHEAAVSRELERAMRALEPVVMVLIGLGVGVVIVLMYMPIFELASAIQ